MTKRLAKDSFQGFHRNQQKSKVHCTLAWLLFAAQEHCSLPGAQVTTGTRRLARSHCRNRGLGMEMIPSNQAVPVERVWTERTEYGSEQEPCTFFIAKEQDGSCSQLCLLLLQPRTASTISKWHNGAGARTRGRGMAELGRLENKETILFLLEYPSGWCELFSIRFDCKWTIFCKGGRRTQTTTTFEIFETHNLEIMGFLFKFFYFAFWEQPGTSLFKINGIYLIKNAKMLVPANYTDN